jgi:hypothetical protein
MPTWPSGSKAPTSNCDAGTDSISSARAVIKQNIDNVNDIIDTFNISSPSNGDVLKYNSTSGVWEQVASSTLAGTPTAYLEAVHSNVGKGSSGTDERDMSVMTVLSDANSLLTITGDSGTTNSINLTPGTYVITHTMTEHAVSDSVNQNVEVEIDGEDSAGLPSLGTIRAAGSTASGGVGDINSNAVDSSIRVRTITNASEEYSFNVTFTNFSEQVLCKTLTIFEKVA